MNFTSSNTGSNHKIRILIGIVLIEFLLFLFSGISFTSFYGNGFFSLDVDPASWLIYLARIPQTITAHYFLGILLDASIILLLFMFIRDPLNNRIAMLLFILMLLFYVTLTGHLAHHNYQFGYCLIFFPFLFSKSLNRSFACEAIRYFILFFYVSAAILKIYYGALADPAHFSHLASGQYLPYFLEGNTGMRTTFNLFLAGSPKIAYSLFIASFLLESFVVVGFFTRRFDHLIAMLLLAFHFSNWFIMDIAPFGQIAFVSLLFFSKNKGI